MPERSLGPSRMALLNLRHKPWRSLSLAAIIAVFAFFLFGGSILNHNLSQGLDSFSRRMGADLLVVPRGYHKAAQALILRGEPNTFYLQAGILDKLRQIPGVEKISPQYFLSSFESDCCDSKVQFIGYDPDSDFVIRPWIDQSLAQIKGDEIIVGARIFSSPGDKLLFFGATYKVAAKLETTGLGLDTSIFVPLRNIYEIIRRNKISLPGGDNPEEYVSAVVIQVSPGQQAQQAGLEILRRYGREYDLDVVEGNKIVSDISRSLHNLSLAVYGAAALFWLQAVLVLALVFSVILKERQRELNLLRILGAARSWLIKMIIQEAIFISIGGALLGIALAALAVLPFSTFIFQSIGLPHLDISLAGISFYFIITLAVSGAAGALASIHSALSVTGFEAYRGLREGE